MPRYQCFIRGENFLLTDHDTGQVEEYGFYTTRWIWAKSEEAAEAKALRKLKQDKFLMSCAQKSKSQIYFEDVSRVTAWAKGNSFKFGGGATWFPMEEKET